MDLRWLDAPAADVAAALAVAGERPRPPWRPTRRQVLLHVNNALVLWFASIGFLTIGIQVDGVQDGRVLPADALAFTVVSLVLVVWLAGTFLLWRWARRPLATRARLRQGRRDLTALANGFRPMPSDGATFSSLVTDNRLGVREYPRFASPDIEFGTVRARSPRARAWQYASIRLAAALPHLVLDARANDGGRGGLPASIDRGQRLRLEGDFDRSFLTYAPAGYGPDALYVLTPDVMAVLVDHAADFDLEIRDDRAVFFRAADAAYTAPEDWRRVDALLRRVAPRLVGQSERYVDERVAGQGAQERVAATGTTAWRPPRPLIGPDGRRLDARTPQTGIGPVVERLAWVGFRAGLYLVPLLFAFAGFMSIVDGR
ncbi:hypothetical protein [Microbacterium sp. LMI1-1-1.1]|uniref:hypothetical protein n=1 Tax=Microbacterium sp. LMI1-1-1.1 TaxID=3135223 RepID=UPI003466ACD2